MFIVSGFIIFVSYFKLFKSLEKYKNQLKEQLNDIVINPSYIIESSL